MFRIDGPGNDAGHFVDEDPLNEIPGTQVTAEWLDSIQEELVAVVLAAGLTLNKLNNTQLLSAIQNLIAGSGNVKHYVSGAALPTSNIGPIWHADYNSVMTWQVFNANGADFTGYASVLVGNMLFDTQPTPRPGYFKTGTPNLSRVTYAAVRGWAKHNGIFVADNIWAAGDIAVCDNPDGTTFKCYDLRAEFPRIWDDLRGKDAGRAFGKWQKGTLTASDYAVSSSSSRLFGTVGINGATRADIGADDGYNSTIYPKGIPNVISSGVSSSPSDTAVLGIARPSNTPFAGMVKF